MRVLFASDYLHVPENTGGTEINTHELCLALCEVGHEPIVLAALVGRGRVGFGARIKLRLPGNPRMDAGSDPGCSDHPLPAGCRRRAILAPGHGRNRAPAGLWRRPV
jgi:hypothetical protein